MESFGGHPHTRKPSKNVLYKLAASFIGSAYFLIPKDTIGYYKLLNYVKKYCLLMETTFGPTYNMDMFGAIL